MKKILTLLFLISGIKKGQPGYRPGLDRDNDGIACDK